MYNHLIFDNKDYHYPEWWDFSLDNTIPVTFEVEIADVGIPSGCAILLIGFKK